MREKGRNKPVKKALCMKCRRNNASRFSKNSEANASEHPENCEGTFLRKLVV